MRKFLLIFAVTGVLCIAGVVSLTLVVRRELARRALVASYTNQIRTAIMEGARERSPREIENWKASDFFTSPQALAAADAISAGDTRRLQQLIDSGLDPDTAGKGGFSLLHWAFAENNLAAFERLLDRGADPDVKLGETFGGRRLKKFLAGESILFTTLRWQKFNYFDAALSHCDEKDPRGSANQTLLISAMGMPVVTSVTEETLARMLDTEPDLNAQGEHGTTAAQLAVIWGRPTLARQILEAGADPEIRDDSGKTVADHLQRTREQARNGRGFTRLGDAEYLRQWLEENAATSETAEVAH